MNGSSPVHQPFVAHQLVEETRIQQMQDGVLDAADILVDRQPVLRRALSTMPPSQSGLA